MKKILFWSAVALMAAVSCNRELETPIVPENNSPKSFVATVDGGQDTKTVMGEISTDTKKAAMFWNGTEQIRVLGAEGSFKNYVAEDVDRQATATFAECEATETLEGENYIAVYPGDMNADASWAGTATDPVKRLWLKDIQSPVVDSYDPTCHVAVAGATSADNTLAFKNVTALIKFTVGNEKVSNPTFYGNNDETVSGNFNVVYNDGNPTVDATAETQVHNKTASLLSSVEKDKTYYIAILPGAFENGFTFEVEIEGKKYQKSTGENRSITISRNQILDLGTITFNPETVNYRPVYFKPTTEWTADNASIYAWAWVTDSQGAWYELEDTDADGIYETEVPETINNILFARVKDGLVPGSDWAGIIAQTYDQDLNDAKECFALDFHDGTKWTGTWISLADAGSYVPALPPVPEYDWYLVGAFNGWTLEDSNYAMTLEGDYYVKKGVTIAADNNQMKINNGTWNLALSGQCPGPDMEFAVDKDYVDNMLVPVGTWDVYLSSDNTKAYFMSVGKTPDQIEVTYIDASKIVVGFSGNFGGVDFWGTPEGDYQAAYVRADVTDAKTFAGSYVYEIEGLRLSADDQFKLRINDEWHGSTGVVDGLVCEGNDNVIVKEAGVFDVTITFDWDGLKSSNMKAVFSKPAISANPVYVSNGAVTLSGNVTIPELNASKLKLTEGSPYVLNAIFLKDYVRLNSGALAALEAGDIKLTFENTNKFAYNPSDPTQLASPVDVGELVIDNATGEILNWDGSFRHNSLDFAVSLIDAVATENGEPIVYGSVSIKMVIPQLVEIEAPDSKIVNVPYSSNEPTTANIVGSLIVTDVKSGDDLYNRWAETLAEIWQGYYREKITAPYQSTGVDVFNVYYQTLSFVTDANGIVSNAYLESSKEPLTAADYTVDELGNVTLSANSAVITDNIIVEVPVVLRSYYDPADYMVTARVKFSK